MSDNPIVEFPIKLCKPIAEITSGFSFAYLQELFVASLLDIAHREDEGSYSGQRTAQTTRASVDDDAESLREDLDRYKLWRAIKRTVRILRHEIEDPDNPSKDLLRSSSASQTEVIASANGNADAFPIPLVTEQKNVGETGLGADERIEKMFSGLWQTENRSQWATSLPPQPQIRSGSRMYRQAPDPTLSLASSNTRRVAEADRPMMLAQDEEELFMPISFGPRGNDHRMAR